jgi:hypothetical protein
MKTKAEIKKYLAELKKEMDKDEQEEDFDKKLPCCDFRGLEEQIFTLEWILKE